MLVFFGVRFYQSCNGIFCASGVQLVSLEVNSKHVSLVLYVLLRLKGVG